MRIGKDFYVFEVIENYEDKLVCIVEEGNQFWKGNRFIGWEDKHCKKAIKSNMEEIVCIPLSKVKKVFKVNFEDVKHG